MSDYPIKLAAEKVLNKNAFPVINIKGKHVEYPFSAEWNGVGFYFTNGRFGAEERMVLDILGTLILHCFYNRISENDLIFSKIIPTSNHPRVKEISNAYISEKLLGYFVKGNLDPQHDIIIPGYFGIGGEIPIFIDGKNQRMKLPQIIKFTDTFLKQQLPLLKKYSSRRFFELIKNTAECELQMHYPIRFFNGKKYQNYPYTIPECTSRLFRITKCQISKTSKNGKVLERSYEITFDTFLGYFYIQNVLSCYTDLLPGHFYSMSEYAQLFYRMLILPYYKGAKIPISLNEIKTRLVLKSENYMTRKTIKRILEELKSNRFIADPAEIRKDGVYHYQYKKNVWKTITQGV